MSARPAWERNEDLNAEADAMQPQADELRALTEQERQRQIDAALAAATQDRAGKLKAIADIHADNTTGTENI